MTELRRCEVDKDKLIEYLEARLEEIENRTYKHYDLEDRGRTDGYFSAFDEVLQNVKEGMFN